MPVPEACASGMASTAGTTCAEMVTGRDAEPASNRRRLMRIAATADASVPVPVLVRENT